jgi:hypothetical protein
MKVIRLKLKPPKVHVTQEEILADLRYPAKVERPARKAA